MYGDKPIQSERHTSIAPKNDVTEQTRRTIGQAQSRVRCQTEHGRSSVNCVSSFDKIHNFRQNLSYSRYQQAATQVLESDGTIHQGSLEGVPGMWQPYALNSCWRVLKYEPEGHFSPHFDAEYQESPGRKSLRTFMIYLNDVPDGSGGMSPYTRARYITPE